ncbi:MAG: periplasmic heavy metal sensor [bacterium]
METYKKNRLLFWLLIVLVVINIAALASFFIYSKKSQEVTCKEQSGMSCTGLCKELNLTEIQGAKVEEINRNYVANAGVLSAGIKEMRASILDELNRETPDSVAINTLVKELSRQQGMLQHENIKQYLELKKVCTPEQAQQLSGLYRDLYGCPMQGKGNMNRHRRGNQQEGMRCE